GIHTSATFVPRSHEFRDVQRAGAVPEWHRATLVVLEYAGVEHRLLTQQRQHVVVDRDQVSHHPVEAVPSRLRLDERFGLRHPVGVDLNDAVNHARLMAENVDGAREIGCGCCHDCVCYGLDECACRSAT